MDTASSAAELAVEPVALRPELAHRHVGCAAQVQVGAGVHVVRLDGEPKTVAAAQLFKLHRVILHDQFLRGLSQVPEEPFRDLAVSHDVARHRRQVTQQIVAAAPLEFLAEPARPVLGTHLPAIEVQHGPATRPLRRGPDLAAGASANKGLEVRVQRRRIEFVALEAQARLRCRARGLARGRGAEPQNRPRAVRARPMPGVRRRRAGRSGQESGPGRRIARAAAPRELGRRGQKRFHARLRGVGRAVIKRFLVYIGNARAAVRRRERQHRHIAVELFPGLLQVRASACLRRKTACAARGRGSTRVELRRAGDVRFAGDQVLHRLLRA